MLQFIDSRLAKLNEGRGFTDVFEKEITEGGFCGSEWDFLCLVEEKESAPLCLEIILQVIGVKTVSECIINYIIS